MKKIINAGLLSLLMLQLTSCATVIIPNYTTVENLTKLNPGMSKQQALTTLDNLYPFDIMNGVSETCEIHIYKYKHPKQETKNKAEDRSGLRGGLEKFADESEAYIIYKNGAIYSVLTDAGKEDFGGLMASIQSAGNACVDIKGCTDPASLNYNPYANMDDGSCTYCECGYITNPNYNPNRPKSECNTPCVKIGQTGGIYDGGEDCTACDLINAVKEGKGNVNINVDLNEMNGNKNKNNTKNNGKNNDKDVNKNTNDNSTNTGNNNSTNKKYIKVY